jgi:hypothetical protein
MNDLMICAFRTQQLKSPWRVLQKQEEFEDTKGVIRIRISKKNRQHNGHNKKDKRTNTYLQSITHRIKDLVTQTPLKTEM